jgi:uncharacterized repeat protein (TIGR04138 family)
MERRTVDEIEEAIRRDGRYPPEAYQFLHTGLDLAAQRKQERRGRQRRVRHVSGQELCAALRVLATRRWGALAGEVLRRWNIRRTRDFGEMVYLMIDMKIMGRQPTDDIADFDDVYDFAEAFGRYEVKLAAQLS